MKKVMILRSRHDPNTEIVFTFFEHIIPEILAKNCEILDVTAEDVTRSQFENLIISFNPDLLIGMGHGFEDKFTGHDKSVVIDSSNIKLLNGKIVYLLSCRTGKELGEMIAQVGGIFIGYEQDWVFEIDRSCNIGSVCEKNYQIFLEIERTMILGLIDIINSGNFNIQNVLDNVALKMDDLKNIGDEEVDRLLDHNKNALVAYIGE